MELHRILQLEPCTAELAQKIVGGYEASYGNMAMVVSGLDGESEYAVNAVLLLKHLMDRGALPRLPITLIPLANRRACSGSSLDETGYAPYYDFLYLRGEAARRVNEAYHSARPRLVVVVRGGRRFRAYATTEEAAKLLGVPLERESIHTLQGIAPLKYSHAVVVQVPPGETLHAAYEIHRASMAARRLSEIRNSVVELDLAMLDPDIVDILKLHGAHMRENKLVIDNRVYEVFLGGSS